jgi:UDP-glucose 4-epimerase
MASALERDPSVEVIVGTDTADPVTPLERTEFVRCDDSYSILARLIRATQVDTVVHASLVVDSSIVSRRALHENNVIGTINLLAATGGSDSAVSSLVVKSSTLVYGSSPRDPTWFSETTPRSSPPRTGLERSLVEMEGYVRSFAEERPDVNVALLRCANVLGDDLVTQLSRALSLPMVPSIAGFDPQLQFVEQDDVVRAFEFVLERGLVGTFNVAGDGKLPWSEIISLAGRWPLPLSPMLTGIAAVPLRLAGGLRLTPETLDLLRFGRGADNSKLKRAGFSYRFTTAETVRRFAGSQRLRRAVGDTRPRYRYQGDVEAFFRHSSAVLRPG